MELKKPETFKDLLNLQRILDENTGKTRQNGFIPRERNKMDIILSLDDEFQEWLKELPSELNFKTWKEKKYSKDKELEELTDILFFILQLANNREYLKESFLKSFYNWEKYPEIDKTDYIEIENRDNFTKNLKFDLYVDQYRKDLFEDYVVLCIWRKFSKEDILNKYWEKWQKNMKRVAEDWTLQEVSK